MNNRCSVSNSFCEIYMHLYALRMALTFHLFFMWIPKMRHAPPFRNAITMEPALHCYSLIYINNQTLNNTSNRCVARWGAPNDNGRRVVNPHLSSADCAPREPSKSLYSCVPVGRATLAAGSHGLHLFPTRGRNTFDGTSRISEGR